VIKPTAAMNMIPNQELAENAKTVEVKLKTVFDSVYITKGMQQLEGSKCRPS
jgi:hypothetical protein